MLIEQQPDALVKFLMLIPNFIWPLIGVIIGAVLAWIPLRQQLKHDSREREKERQMSLRRDVYLSAAEKIGQQLSYLANFYQTREGSPEGYNEAIQQIHIIGNTETVTAINKFNDKIIEAFLELIPRKEEINFLEQRRNYVMDCLGKGLQEPQKSFNEFKKIFNEGIKLTYELAGKCRKKTQLAEELLTPVIVAIRKELDTPFEEETYRAMMKISQNKWKENLEKHIVSMKEKCTQALKLMEQIVEEDSAEER